MEIIKTEHVVFNYIRKDENGEIEAVKRAVDDVSISIQRGKFTAILGHNGSGKSTLAKQLNGILMPSEGAIWVENMDTREEEYLWDIRQTAGLVFQNPDNQLISNVVEEDVGFGPENLGIPTDEIWERVVHSLKAVGMYSMRKESPNRLSGGQKQRVAIAGILAMKPSCIILDEPTAMLDPNGRKEVLDALYELNQKEKVTVILITHYMEEVIHADNVIVMDQGKVVMEGTPNQVFRNVEQLRAIRLNVPQVTELAYELRRNGFPIKEGILTKEELIAEILKVRGKR
ncbi:energy-coupling factor transporter ATPase [[Clostridium] polysaccharolyticum]|uniref:Energy-coupling factor transport system ATP-binding protein n=1 Tax=[Clostridium] polysaccharolyticum TaxID=29364 RepID=A0A1I0DR80_9FIRM|nr:energy-coupling factor transporter ATPase [[Clostridium] polysaccharolyticum]SET35093.1 energy-coupling factor transport system ATP-binding protein [[Clostridium] polysaccharolyticum]